MSTVEVLCVWLIILITIFDIWHAHSLVHNYIDEDFEERNFYKPRVSLISDEQRKKPVPKSKQTNSTHESKSLAEAHTPKEPQKQQIQESSDISNIM